MINSNEDKGQKTNSSELPPPPPLPDVLLPKVSPNTKSCNNIRNDKASSFEETVKRVGYAEGFFSDKPFYSCNTHLQSQLQDGPKCGLVALSIATSITDKFVAANELFDEAIQKGFTTFGEMYSAEDMASLAESSTKFKTLVLDSGINSHIDCIIQCLQNGGLMLVPYDADYNNSPSCKRGHNAHWAVMSGIVIFTIKDYEESEERSEEKSDESDCESEEEDVCAMVNPELYPQCQCLKTDSKFFSKSQPDKIKILRKANDIYFVKKENDMSNAKKCKLYLAGKHGKSKHLAIWPFEALAESNNNLVEISEPQRAKRFKLPDGGISSGLKDKAVLLHL